MGTCMAYHMAELGYEDVLLLERKNLGCGTTWHAAGLLGRLRASSNLMKMAKYSLDLYVRLSEETDQDIGLKQNGSLSVTDNHERLEEFCRGIALAGLHDISAKAVSPAEIAEMYPGIRTDDLVGGVFVEGDGQCNPADLNQAMAKAARKSGAKIVEGALVEKTLMKNNTVTGVKTDHGVIETSLVVNCAGMWAREFAARHGVSIPLHACEHYYIVTEPFAAMTPDLPVLREPDRCAYYKEDAGKLLLGAFERNARLWGEEGIPEDFCFDELAGDFEHFTPVFEGAVHRFPPLEEAGLKTFFCGPESFSADGRYYLGPASGTKGYYMGCGFNSIGIQSAGGAAMALSRWIRDDAPPFDLWDIDSRRIFPFQASDEVIRVRAPESLGDLYDMHWPYKQPKSARNLRHSPVHHALQQRGACFGVAAGWERANWFAHTGIAAEYEHSYGKTRWFECAAIEHKAVREDCAMFDLSSFGKFRLLGRDALSVLQYVSSADIDVDPGRVVYTQWLNPRGGIEADLTITRLHEQDFLIATGPTSAGRDWHWLKQRIPHDAHAHLVDVTANEAILALMGPNSRKVLAGLCSENLGNEAFPFATAQNMTIGAAPVRAQRISYVGELGWELFVPSEWAIHVFTKLMATQQITLAGMHTLDACRIEKAFRHFGHELSDEDTLIEAGMGFLAKPDKPATPYGHFIGREAFLRQKEAGTPRKRMVQFCMDDPEVMLYHNEPILMDGDAVGYITSGAYGHHLQASVGMGYVHHQGGVTTDLLSSAEFHLQVGLNKHRAKAQLQAFYDPKFIKPKA